MSDEMNLDWLNEMIARAERFRGRTEISFWGEARRELARLIYDVERNRNRPE